MPRRQADILSPSGTGVGQDFLLGLQDRNRSNLLEIFSAATPVMEEMAKVKPESWRNMRGLFTALESTFGIQTIMSGALKPAQMIGNQATNFLSGALAPLMIGINNIKRDIERRAMANPIPTLVGTGIGFVAGFMLAGPAGAQLGSMLGGFLGSTFGPEPASYNQMQDILSFFGLTLLGPPSDPSGVGDLHVDLWVDIPTPPDLTGTISQPGGQFGDRIGQITDQFR